MQMLYRCLCDKFGYHCTTVDSCKEALAVLEQIKFDLIIMDIRLVGINGLKCTVAIRETEARLNIHTPIVAVTAQAMPIDRELCLAAGMVDYLSKPFTIQQFHNLVEHSTNKVLPFREKRKANGG